mmetsp:Transcript_24190/g.59404  ORF Transcript_24190/g.59404 Transcript_24190/m.59404 type:complete len:390 (-) Transcript_24190:141-1310(-)
MRSAGASFKDILDTCAIDQAPGVPTGWGITNLAKWLLWEDPLLAHLSPQVSDRDMIKHYRHLASALNRRIGAAMRGGGGGGGGERGKQKERGSGGGSAEARAGGSLRAEEARWAHPLALPAALSKVLARKMAFRRDLHDAYAAKNRVAMALLIGYNLAGDGNRHRRFSDTMAKWPPYDHRNSGEEMNKKALNNNNLIWGGGSSQKVESNNAGSESSPNGSDIDTHGGNSTSAAALLAAAIKREMLNTFDDEDKAAANNLAHDKDVSSGAAGGGGGGGGELGALLASLIKMHRLHRGMWRAHYKPHGWEIIEGRYGTLRSRLEGVGDLIQALLEGRIAVIEELEPPPGSTPAQPPPRVYNAEIYQVPLMCWARAVTPAMPSVKPDHSCGL